MFDVAECFTNRIRSTGTSGHDRRTNSFRSLRNAILPVAILAIDIGTNIGDTRLAPLSMHADGLAFDRW